MELRQVRLLLWKNMRVKLRTWYATLVELLIPLVLCIMLVLLRTVQPVTLEEETHYEPKPLPSAGWVSLIESSCDNFILDHNHLRTFPNASTTEFLTSLDALMRLEMSSALQDISSTLIHLSKEDLMVSLLQIPSNQSLLMNTSLVVAQDMLSTISSQDLYESISTPKQLQHTIDAWFNQSTDEKRMVQDMMAEGVTTSQLSAAVEDVLDLTSHWTHLSELRKQLHYMHTLHSVLHLFPLSPNCVQRFINLSNSQHNHTTYQSVNDHSEALRYLWSVGQVLFCGKDPNTETQTSHSVFGSMSNQDSMQHTQLQKYVSRLLSNHPKILYAPNETAADAVITKMNRTLSMLEDGARYAAELLQGTTRLKESLKEYSQQWTIALSRFHTTWTVSSLLDKLAVIQAASCTYEDVFNKTDLNLFQGFKDEHTLLQYAINRAPFDNITVFTSLIFNTVDEHLPEHVIYKIRQNVSMTPSTRSARALVRYPGPRSFEDSYYRFGFLFIQDLVERAIMDIHTNGMVIEPGSFIEQAPFPCFLYDAFLLNVESVFSLILSISWVYCVAVLVKSMVQEKENHLCEVMNVMGMDRYMIWMSWFITVMVQMSFTMILLSGLLWKGGVLPLSSPVFVFILLELFSASSIVMSIMLSTLYTQAKVATACAGIVFLISALPSLFISIREQSLMTLVPFYIKVLCSFSSTSAFGIATKHLLYYELNGQGCNFNNFYSSPIEDEDFTVAHAMGMMIFDCLLYLITAVLIEKMCTRNICWWFKSCIQHKSIEALSMISSKQEQWFEIEPNAEVMVRLEDVCKQYASGSRKMALQDVSLTLYQNEVTALLGHNGAGKSTTMNILTGVTLPTSGSVSIHGYPIRNRRDVLNLSLGTCPQHNVLFSHLTVYEHLLFYALLKSSQSFAEAENEVNNMLNDVKMNAKRNDLVDTLSGGMKRTLSVAIAFIGGSTTVILDEPTAGVDPFARRSIWDLINKCKTERSILIATHLMDEADILADRIAVISVGRMKAFGSPLFLKERLGDGYLLTVVWQDDSSEDKESSNKLIELCCKHGKIPIVINSFVGQSTYQLQEWNQDQIISLLSALENEECRIELGINSFGIRDTTLDEILMKLTSEDPSNSNTSQGSNSDTSSGYAVGSVDMPELSYQYNYFLFLSTQLYAILYKRYICVTRNWRSLVSQLILPAVFFAGGMSIALPSMIHNESPPLSLSTFQFANLSSHNKTSTIFYYNQHFYESSYYDKCYVNTSAIVTSFYQIPGVGGECVMKNIWQHANWTSYMNRQVTPYKYEDTCKYRRYYSTNLLSKPLKEFSIPSYLSPKQSGVSYYPSCICMKRGTALQCDPIPSTPKHHRILQTADWLFDITGIPFNKYIINTNNNFELRFGGLGLGLEKTNVPNGFGVNVSRELRMLAVRHISKVYYNNRAFHAMPIFLNVINNALLRAALTNNSTINPSAFGISVINHPMPGSTEVLSFAKMMQSNDVLIAVFLVVGMAFVPSSCVYFLVYERSSLSFHLQWMNALSPALYWIANLFWDIINLSLPITVCTLIIWLFNIPIYTRSDNLMGVIILLLMYGCSSIPVVYMMSVWFEDQSNAYIAMMIFNLLTGIGTCFTSYLLQLFGLNNTGIAWMERILRRVFLIFPGFCLGRGVLDMALNDYTNQYLIFIGESYAITSPFNWDSLYLNITLMAVVGSTAFLCTLLCDYWIHKDQTTEQTKPVLSDRGDAEDSDVAAERSRVLSGQADDDMVRIEALSKVFTKGIARSITAVDCIHLGVAQGECFGLLGVNGAGKSTVFKMLTRIIMPSQGSVYASGHNIYSKSSVLRHIGYCPQSDALYDELTPREHIYYYGCIHGWDRVSVHKMTEWLLHSMRLLEYADVETGALSGGTKRKLSTALALVGDAKMLFLDEPSSGMDPGARQFIQSVIKTLSKAGKCILFTSHSMEECEALCGRLSVMVKGRLRCLGTCQHLKDKYGDGYSIRLRLNKDCSQHNRQDIEDLFVSNLSNCILKETHLAYIHLETSGVPLSNVFSLCKEALSKSCLAIDSYSVSQNNLDNVFISFVREQTRLVRSQ